MTTSLLPDRRTARQAHTLRRGLSLIEIIVAMSIIAIAFSTLLALQVRLTTRQKRAAEQSARNAILYQEVNRIESMRFTALDTMLVNDIDSAGTFSYARRYSVTTNPAGASCTSSRPCKDVKVRVVPSANPDDSVFVTVRREKTPSYNPLFTP